MSLTPDKTPREPEAHASASGATDMLAGLLFAAFGVGALIVGRDYAFGTTLRMGPGFLPRLVAIGLVVMGAILVARGIIAGGGRLPTIALRPILLIAAAIIAFATTIDRLGLFIACILTVCIGALAETGANWRTIPIVAVGLAAFCAILFGHVLNLSMPIWPR